MTAAAALLERIERLEGAQEVRRVATRYFALCDTLGPNTPMDELAQLFTQDAIWAGIGPRYAAGYGEMRGREAIMSLIKRHREPVPHFAMNAHFLTSEYISVASDTAEGRWLMLQTSTYADGRADLRSARIDIGFLRTGEVWQIARFQTENIFSRPISHWDSPAATPLPE